MREIKDDDTLWDTYGDFTSSDLAGKTVEFYLADSGGGGQSMLGVLIACENPEGLLSIEVHTAPYFDERDRLVCDVFTPRPDARFHLERHENPKMAAFRLKYRE